MKAHTNELAQELFDTGVPEKKLLAAILALYGRFHEIECPDDPQIPMVVLLPDGGDSVSCAAISSVEDGLALILTGACAIAENNGVSLATLQKQLGALYGEGAGGGVMGRLGAHATGPRRPRGQQGRGKRGR